MARATGRNHPFLEHYASQKYLLSTSQPPNMTNLLDEDDPQMAWLGANFAAVTKDGYGICYRFIGKHSIVAHVSSYKSAVNTDSARFRNRLQQALRECAGLFGSARAVA